MTIRRATFKYRRSYDACSMLGKEKKGKFRVCIAAVIHHHHNYTSKEITIHFGIHETLPQSATQPSCH